MHSKHKRGHDAYQQWEQKTIINKITWQTRLKYTRLMTIETPVNSETLNQ